MSKNLPIHMTPSSQLLLHWAATRYKGSQILGGGGDPPPGGFRWNQCTMGHKTRWRSKLPAIAFRFFLLLKEASGTPQTLPRSSPSGVQIPVPATSDLFLVTLDFLESALGDIWTTKFPLWSVFLVDGSNFGDEFQPNSQHVPRRDSRSVYNLF